MDNTEDEVRYDPKAVVANSGKPRKTISWATAFLGSMLNAQLERAAAIAALARQRLVPPTTAERAFLAEQYRMRARYGRGWFRRRRHSCSTPHQGPRECERRRRQIARGMLTPVYDPRASDWKDAA